MFLFYKKQLLKNEKENNFFWYWYEQEEMEKRGILWQQQYSYENRQEQLNKIPVNKIDNVKSSKEKKDVKKEVEKKQKKENNIFDKQEIFIEQKTKSIFDEIQYQQQYEEYKQEENLTTSSIIKGQQKIYITTENSVITYNYETILNKEENLYGTLTIEGKLKPYEKIKYQIEPNSGYKIKEVLLKNDQGDLLEVKEESFVLPNTNAYLSVTYEAEVENPNTADPILLIFLGIFLLLGILIKLYKKWNWLK